MDNYDVVICGGGLAGLTLALQLKQNTDASILVVERMQRPLPIATHKVGESTVEVGSHYLASIVGLEKHLSQNHLHKLGIRYFFGDPAGPFECRPEFGQSQFPEVHSYQIDRGVLENALLEMVEAQGIDLLEGRVIDSIRLGTEQQHQVEIRSKTEGNKKISCRWVIDSTGRRRTLQKQLNLEIPAEEAFNSSWWRVPGNLSIDDFVGQEETSWHQRVPGKIRRYSTNHLMGHGYWVWIIPLSSEYTSIGIVTKDSIHPFDSYNTYDKSLNWLKSNEPFFFNKIKDFEPVDFKVMKDYTFFSKQVISKDRWACTGISAQFADPLNSPGTDFIGYSNCIITQAIQADLNNELSEDRVDFYNAFLTQYGKVVTRNIQVGYTIHDKELVIASKLVWDFVLGWSTSGTMMFSQFYLDETNAGRVFSTTSLVTPLSMAIQKLFLDWGRMTTRKDAFEFIDYLSIPFVYQVRKRSLVEGRTIDQLIMDQQANMEILKELAVSIFKLAIEDCYPDEFERIKDKRLNPLAIDLNPSNWEKNGLFSATTEEPDPLQVNRQFRSLFRFCDELAMA